MELLMNKAIDLQVKAKYQSKGVSKVLLGEREWEKGRFPKGSLHLTWE